MSGDSKRSPWVWILATITVMICAAVFFAAMRTAVPVPESTKKEEPQKVSGKNNISSNGWLQRTRHRRTVAEKDEIAKKSKELFKREMEVGKDIIKHDYQTALEKLVEYYTWTFENDFAPSAGVRSSFGLAHWRALVKAYPPAADKLREMADHLESTMRTEEFSEIRFDKKALPNALPQEREDFIAQALMREICNFNDVLGTPERGVELLSDLAENEPQVAKACWRGAEDVLFATKSYELLHEFITDLEAEYVKNMETTRKVLSNKPPCPPSMSQREFDEIQRKSAADFIEMRIGRLLDFGIGTGQDELVHELANRTAEEIPAVAEFFRKYQ